MTGGPEAEDPLVAVPQYITRGQQTALQHLPPQGRKPGRVPPGSPAGLLVGLGQIENECRWVEVAAERQLWTQLSTSKCPAPKASTNSRSNHGEVHGPPMWNVGPFEAPGASGSRIHAAEETLGPERGSKPRDAREKGKHGVCLCMHVCGGPGWVLPEHSGRVDSAQAGGSQRAVPSGALGLGLEALVGFKRAWKDKQPPDKEEVGHGAVHTKRRAREREKAAGTGREWGTRGGCPQWGLRPC